MDGSARRAELATLYLLGHRGEALRALCPELGPAEKQILDGLCSAERSVRAAALAQATRDMLAALPQLELASWIAARC
jgi:hypothetical protein